MWKSSEYASSHTCVSHTASIEKIDEEKISEDEYDLSETEIEDFTMTSAIDILNISTKIVPQYNGSLENLQGFIDALILINTLKASRGNSGRIDKNKANG